MSGALNFDPARSRAVLIGCGRFDRPGAVSLSPALESLRAVRYNLRDLELVLEDPDRIGIGDVVRLDNPAYPDVVSELRAALAPPPPAAADLDPGGKPPPAGFDLLLVYYSGHGLVGSDGGLRLATRNTTYDDRDDNALPYKSFRRVIDACPARYKLIFLDCCFAAAALVQGQNALQRYTRAEKSNRAGAAWAAAEREFGTYLMMATSATESAYTPNGRRHSGFTGYFLDVLRAGLDNGKDVLVIRDIFDVVQSSCVSAGLPEPDDGIYKRGDQIKFCHNSKRPDRQQTASEGLANAGRVNPPDLSDADRDRLQALQTLNQARLDKRKTIKSVTREQEKIFYDLVCAEGKDAEASPVAQLILSDADFQWAQSRNPAGLHLLAEKIVLTIDAEGNTDVEHSRTVELQTEELRMIRYVAQGDPPGLSPEELNFEAVVDGPDGPELNIYPLSMSKGEGRWDYMLVFDPPVPVRKPVSYKVTWSWPKMFQSLMRGPKYADYWKTEFRSARSRVPLAETVIRVANTEGRLGKIVCQCPATFGKWEELSRNDNWDEYRWVMTDFSSLRRVLLKLQWKNGIAT